MTYNELIQRKLPRVYHAGFDPSMPVNPKLFDWQSKLVAWALRVGRAALFEDCGLGKGPQQLEWAKQVMVYTGKPVLGLCPLAVADQMVAEGDKFGYSVVHCRTLSDFDSGKINYTNYDRLHLFDPVIPDCGGVVLDESSCLKNFAGKVAQHLVEVFSATPYRLCCTATPAPNDYEELGMHAEFLGWKTRFEMLAAYFIHDSANTSEWRLKKHSTKDFWRWIATWAACVSKPSDIGYPNDGFDLPPLEIKTVQVSVDETEAAGEELFRLPSMSGTEMHKEMRLTCAERVKAVKRILDGMDGEPVVVWCNTNYEADELLRALPGTLEVRGSDSMEDKEKKLRAFTFGESSRIIGKPSIAGKGLNWQHCACHIFVGLSYSFEDFYQAMRRGYRFGQKRPFTAYVVHAQTEGRVKDRVMEKMEQHKAMLEQMKTAAAALELEPKKQRKLPQPKVHSAKMEYAEMFCGDCVKVASKLTSESVGFSIYSPPFASLYIYSDDPHDMGNCASEDEFFEQYEFLVKELFRLTQPGRLSAVHCADLPAQIWKDGYQGLKDFSGMIIKAHEDAGWIYHCRVTIWKDPVVEMQRTKALGLLYKQLRKDSSRCRVGNPDYLLLFRRLGENADLIDHERADYPVGQWQRDASPVWMDINQTNVLNRDGAKEANDEKHICPLQLDTIRRAIRLWSNPGDLVCSPFMGIGSEAYCAVEMGRRFIGVELKKSYFDQAVQYVAKAERESLLLPL